MNGAMSGEELLIIWGWRREGSDHVTGKKVVLFFSSSSERFSAFDIKEGV